MTHLNEEQLILYHYGEEAYRKPAERRAVAEHLAACDDCRISYESLQRVLAAVEALPVPERAEGYGREVWAQLRPRLDVRPGGPGKTVLSGWAWWFAPQRWALAGAMAALLIVAFLVGRMTQEETSTSAAISPQVRERILMVAVGDHLERSQMILVELSNMPSNGKVDISSEQRMASELVGENRLYRQTALNAGEVGVASVLDQLERVLVEVANSPSEVSSKEMETLRKRIESQGILFKVRVIGSDVRQRAHEAPAETAPDVPAGQPRKTI
jgi:anti-sigma factor RsiW